MNTYQELWIPVNRINKFDLKMIQHITYLQRKKLILLSEKKKKPKYIGSTSRTHITEQQTKPSISEFGCGRLHNSHNRNRKETTEINQGLQPAKGKSNVVSNLLRDGIPEFNSNH